MDLAGLRASLQGSPLAEVDLNELISWLAKAIHFGMGVPMGEEVWVLSDVHHFDKFIEESDLEAS